MLVRKGGVGLLVVGRRGVGAAWSSSYFVNKTRTLEWWKNDDTALSMEMRRARCVLFVDKQPLMLPVAGSVHARAVAWLTYAELTKYLQENVEDGKLGADDLTTALVDAVPDCSTNDENEEFAPVVAAGLKSTVSEGIDIKRLEEKFGGTLTDMRLAILSVTDAQQAHTLAKAQSLLRWARTYNFCPKCAGALVQKASKAFASCDKCKRQFHPTVSPVALCLVTDESNSHCLLVRQPRHRTGVYTAVAGFSEVGESLEATARREVAEEVGVDLADVRYAARSQPWPFPLSSLMCAFVATADRRQHPLVDRSELEDAEWFSREQISAALQVTSRHQLLADINDSEQGASKLVAIPPAGTLAHQVISDWLESTATSS